MGKLKSQADSVVLLDSKTLSSALRKLIRGTAVAFGICFLRTGHHPFPYKNAERLATPAIRGTGIWRCPVATRLDFKRQNHSSDDIIGLAYGVVRSEVDIALHPATLIFAMCVAVVTTLFVVWRQGFMRCAAICGSALRAPEKGTNEDARHGRLRSGLVVAEVAVSIVLLVGTWVLVLFVAGLAAWLLPARRATQVNPLIALRSE